jgi:hypothetical protein
MKFFIQVINRLLDIGYKLNINPTSTS